METVLAEVPTLALPEKTRLLALVGRRYCGKSTVADMVVKLDSRFTKRSFATVLKEEFAKASGVDIKKLYTVGVKDIYRPAMFDYEKQAKANNRYYFAEKLFSQIAPGEFTVIDDLRFLEELKLCLDARAAIYKVHSDPHLRRQRGWIKSEIDAHYSETELDFPGYYFWQITGGVHQGKEHSNGRGGTIFNTKSDFTDPDRNYLRGQVIQIIKSQFPMEI